MRKKENIENNMEFLIRELQKEWDVSKEIKHRVTISAKEADEIRIGVQQQIVDIGEFLNGNLDIKFQDSMKLCKENYITLRIARKLIAGQNAARVAGKTEFTIAFDKEEIAEFRRISCLISNCNN